MLACIPSLWKRVFQQCAVYIFYKSSTIYQKNELYFLGSNRLWPSSNGETDQGRHDDHPYRKTFRFFGRLQGEGGLELVAYPWVWTAPLFGFTVIPPICIAWLLFPGDSRDRLALTIQIIIALKFHSPRLQVLHSASRLWRPGSRTFTCSRTRWLA